MEQQKAEAAKDLERMKSKSHFIVFKSYYHNIKLTQLLTRSSKKSNNKEDVKNEYEFERGERSDPEIIDI